MTLEEIERLIRRLEGSDIATLTVSDETSSLTLRIGAAALGADVASREPAPTAEEAPVMRAPGVGRLRLRHPEAAPSQDDGFPRAIVEGDIVAFLECGTVLRPVVADRAGTIGAPLQADGTVVGFGTPLFGFI